MSTTIANPSTKNKTLNPTVASATDSIVAIYKTHQEAEEAVRELERAGIPIKKISIIGRDFQLREDVQGYYRPSDAAKEGAGFGAWFGGLFGLLMGFGLFVLPIAGTVVVLGPLAGLIAGAIGGAGIGALINALIALGMSKEQALKYQARLQAGEFLVTVIGTSEEIERAAEVIDSTNNIEAQTFKGVQAVV
ncbi:MAG TPA: general stress protein [Alphaproteobacteria bacterium]|nr:general stress protein [Alphaproteobacteria bacterium]